ncbi:MAG TPA: Sec-independent protein translocase protein TatB [Dehalococcoidia bacterium]|nr:Sec-independent protein translocase protein TatB [Dehalococcoidia bacterium]
MDFLGIGLPELILVLLVALIVLGPQRLPQAAVQIARMVKTLRRYASEVTADLKEEFPEFNEEYQGLRKDLRRLRVSVNQEMASVSEEADKTIQAAGTSVPRQPIIETTSTPPPQDGPSTSDNPQNN